VSKTSFRDPCLFPLSGLQIEEVLFAFASSGDYQAACDFLEMVRQQMLQTDRVALDKEETGGRELCLSLHVSLEGFRQWSERLNALRPDPVSVFLKHVISTVPFYSELFAKQLTRKGICLSDFPTVSRENIVHQYHRFLSSRFAEEPRKYFKTTSGTTAKPLIVWFDLVSFYELSYVTYNRVAGLIPDLDSAILPGGLAAVQVTDHPYTWRASTVLPSVKFARLHRRVFDGASSRNFKLIKELRDTPPPLLCGMPSSLLRFSNLDRTARPIGDRIRPRAIFVSGENLFEDWRRRLEQWFQCSAYSAYISSEGGLLAMECKKRAGLHVQEARARLEIIDETGKTSPCGSGEIVLTNFMNWAMPFVRYRTGDQATIAPISCDCGFAGSNILDLYAREAPYFSVPSSRVDARVLDAPLTQLPISEFRVVQDDNDRFSVMWVPNDSELDSSRVGQAIIGIVRNALGDVDVQVQRLERLTLPGQKARRYVRMTS